MNKAEANARQQIYRLKQLVKKQGEELSRLRADNTLLREKCEQMRRALEDALKAGDPEEAWDPIEKSIQDALSDAPAPKNQVQAAYDAVCADDEERLRSLVQDDTSTTKES